MGGGRYRAPEALELDLSSLQEMCGDPTEVRAVTEAHDPEIGRRLWAVSEELTGVTFAHGGST